MAKKIPILRIRKPLLTTLFSTVFIIFSTSGWGASLSGQVFAVTSGEQITLSGSSHQFREIQLIGIDSPPTSTSVGRLSRRHLHMLLAGKFVTVVYHSLTPEGSILGRVFHGGVDISLRMIEAGQVRISADERVHEEVWNMYQKAQKISQERKLGIWNKSAD